MPSALSAVGLEKPPTGPHALDAAMLLFQLRRVQSNWYQELFHSSRDAPQKPSAYIWQMCHEMRIWSESFPKSLPPVIRELFELELLYSYVYCLAPSGRVPTVSEVGKTLIFEYSISYMQKIFPICKDPINTTFYTYHDALRVYFIGSQFLAVLSDNFDLLLNAVAPYTAPIVGGPSPPPIPNPGRTDNIDRSINCIDQIIETLKAYGERWYDSNALQSSFEAQAQAIVVELHHRRQQRQMQLQANSNLENGSHTLLPANHVENMLNDKWAGMGHTFADGTILQRNQGSMGHERRL